MASPDRRKRVDWTVFEQSEVYSGIMDLIKLKKIDLPVPPGKFGAGLMQLMREAQLKLPEQRRRPLANIDSLTPSSDLAKRLVENGVIPRNFQDVYRKGVKPVLELAVDPKAEQIAQLEGRLAELKSELEDQNARVAFLESELKAAQRGLEAARPDKVLSAFFSDIAAEAIRKSRSISAEANAAQTQASQAQEELPDFERERRRGTEPQTAQRLPRVLIVGGGAAHERTAKPAAKLLAGKVDCRFWADESYDMLTARAKGADAVFVLMGAASHDTVKKAQAANPNVQRVLGYQAEHLANMISNWLEKQP